MQIPEVKLRVSCSKGTYIRTLCHDIGEKLGCGGAMESLVRTRAGGFTLPEALTLSEVEQLREEDSLEERILPLEQVFSDLPKLTVNEDGVKPLQNGNPLKTAWQTSGEKPLTGKAAVFFPDGRFAAVYEWDARRRHYMPVKMFL